MTASYRCTATSEELDASVPQKERGEKMMYDNRHRDVKSSPDCSTRHSLKTPLEGEICRREIKGRTVFQNKELDDLSAMLEGYPTHNFVCSRRFGDISPWYCGDDQQQYTKTSSALPSIGTDSTKLCARANDSR